MPNQAKINPLNFLVFALPVSLPFIFMVPASWNPATSEWENTIAGIEVNFIIYAIALLYPIASAVVFFKHRLLLWSAAAAYAILTIICMVYMGGSPNAFGMILIVELAAIAWSLLCSLAAFFIGRKKQKGQVPCA
jgi:hypothetical protein